MDEREKGVYVGERNIEREKRKKEREIYQGKALLLNVL